MKLSIAALLLVACGSTPSTDDTAPAPVPTVPVAPPEPAPEPTVRPDRVYDAGVPETSVPDADAAPFCLGVEELCTSGIPCCTGSCVFDSSSRWMCH